MEEIGLILGAAIAVFGALVGVRIRRVTHFLYPYEFLTGGVVVALTIFTMVAPLTPLISLSFVIGYVFGYCIDGYRAYFIARKRLPKIKGSPGEPWVTYDVDGRKAIAIQTNRALWQRLVRKNHVFILCKGPFGVADWNEPTKYPLFPLFDRKMMMFDDHYLAPVTWSIDAGKAKHPKRQAMIVRKAHGSMISIDQLCFEADAVEKANQATAEAQEKYTRLIHFVKAEMPRFFANFLAETYDKAPRMAFLEATRRSEELAAAQEGNTIKLLTEAEKELKASTAEQKEEGNEKTKGSQAV